MMFVPSDVPSKLRTKDLDENSKLVKPLLNSLNNSLQSELSLHLDLQVEDLIESRKARSFHAGIHLFNNLKDAFIAATPTMHAVRMPRPGLKAAQHFKS